MRQPLQYWLARLGVTVAVILTVITLAVHTQAAWATLETEHFYIHFDSEYAALAPEVARRAELVHHEMVSRLGHAPQSKTHVVVQDLSDAANGYATPVFENRMVIYPVFPSLAIGYLNGFDFTFDDWLTLLIMHEYTHILHMDMRSPSTETITSVFGRVPYFTSPIVLSPPFLIEGFAVYHESMSGSGRGNSSFYDMYLRTAALANRLPELDQVLGEYPLDRWHPGGHIYFYGHAFLNYIAQQFGQEALDKLNASLIRRPDSLARAVIEATGRDTATLWRDWQVATTSEARQFVERLVAEPVTMTYPSETVGHHVLFPSPSPDGSKIAYVALGGVAPAVRTLDRTTGKERSLATTQALLTEEIAWHPEGDYLVFAALRDLGGGRSSTQLVRVDAKKGSMRFIPHTERAYSPTFDPQGERLAYIVRTGMSTELRLRHLETGQDTTLFADPSVVLLSVNWSPLADQLALTVWSPNNGASIALYDLKESSLRPLVGQDGNFQSPAWSRDGRYVIFSADPTGVFNLYAYDLAEEKLKRLTNTITGLFHPRFTSEETVVAMEYTADGYRLVEMSFQPEFGQTVPAAAPDLDQRLALPDAQILGQKKYAPWRSLLPKFWLPSFQDMANETHVGVTTAGGDVLGNTSYAAHVSFGIATGRLSYDFEVMQSIGRGGRWLANARISDVPTPRSTPVGVGWHDLSQQVVGLRWEGPLARGRQAVWLQGIRSATAPYGSREPGRVENLLEGGWEARTTGGRLGLRTNGLWRLKGSTDVDHRDAWKVIAQHATEFQWPRGHALLFTTNLGLSRTDEQLWLGRETDGFGLRGYPAKHWDGNFVVRMNVEGRLPLHRIQRGLLDSPVFLKDIALHPFIEAGYADVWRTEAKRRTFALGAEVGFDTYLGYGAARADWRVGIAYGVGETRPHVYLRVVSLF